MPATQLEAISPELVLVSPELRAALAAEFRAGALSGGRQRLQPGPGRGASVAAPAAVARYPVVLAAAVYAAQRLIGVLVQGAALVAALIVVLFALTHV